MATSRRGIIKKVKPKVVQEVALPETHDFKELQLGNSKLKICCCCGEISTQYIKAFSKCSQDFLNAACRLDYAKAMGWKENKNHLI